MGAPIRMQYGSAAEAASAAELAALTAAGRHVVLHFSALPESDQNALIARLSAALPDHSVFDSGTGPERRSVTVLPVVPRARVRERQGHALRAIGDYRRTCAELIERYRAGTLSRDWRTAEHGGHCRFENRRTGQVVEAALREWVDPERIDPYFFAMFVHSTAGLEPVAELLTDHFHDAARVLAVVTGPPAPIPFPPPQPPVAAGPDRNEGGSATHEDHRPQERARMGHAPEPSGRPLQRVTGATRVTRGITGLCLGWVWMSTGSLLWLGALALGYGGLDEGLIQFKAEEWAPIGAAAYFGSVSGSWAGSTVGPAALGPTQRRRPVLTSSLIGAIAGGVLAAAVGATIGWAVWQKDPKSQLVLTLPMGVGIALGASAGWFCGRAISRT